ncbi:hypothetical protein SEA_SAKAI_43 [Arthrobacter phage Sakai]|nr:hypothetical protein SEA_GORPY_44 [Arthrobacter phage Gorpy]UVK61990.1 hypothetical protein SEA_SAKAI_43 [Arthrobacter phage Sakai]
MSAVVWPPAGSLSEIRERATDDKHAEVTRG